MKKSENIINNLKKKLLSFELRLIWDRVRKLLVQTSNPCSLTSCTSIIMSKGFSQSYKHCLGISSSTSVTLNSDIALCSANYFTFQGLLWIPWFFFWYKLAAKLLVEMHNRIHKFSLTKSKRKSLDFMQLFFSSGILRLKFKGKLSLSGFMQSGTLYGR